MINWSTLIKKFMQTYIVIVSGSILNVSFVHISTDITQRQHAAVRIIYKNQERIFILSRPLCMIKTWFCYGVTAYMALSRDSSSGNLQDGGLLERLVLWWYRRVRRIMIYLIFNLIFLLEEEEITQRYFPLIWPWGSFSYHDGDGQQERLKSKRLLR